MSQKNAPPNQPPNQRGIYFDKGAAYITRWTCDVCKVRAFDTYEAAVEHEKTCTGPPQARKAGESEKAIDLTKDDDSDEKNVASLTPTGNGSVLTVWTCDVCRSAEFPTFQQAAEHEKTCTGKPSGSTPTKKKIGSAPIPGPTSNSSGEGDPRPWLCDKCQVADFSTFEEAAEHEKRCTGKPAASKKPPTTANSSIAEQKRPALPSSSPSPKQKQPALQTSPPAPEQKRPALQSSPPVPEQKQPALQRLSPATDQIQSVSALETSTPGLLDLSPMVRDENDSPDFIRLSKLDAELLRHIDLVEIRRPEDGNNGYTISLRCHHCKHTLPSPKNVLSFGKIILWDSFNHLISGCEKVPPRVVDAIKALKSTSEHGKIVLGDFLSQFLQANGIKEGEEGGLVVLPYSKFLVAPGSRRDRWVESSGAAHASESPVAKTNKADVPSPSSTRIPSSSEQGSTSTGKLVSTQQQDFPSNVVLPLIHENFAEYSSGLSPFIDLAMRQMHFHHNAAEGRNPPGVYALDLKCKHCGGIAKVQTRDTVHKGVYSMTYSHLSKSCSHMPDELRASLENLQSKKRGPAPSNARGGGMGVRSYCQHLMDAYDLIDIEGDDEYLSGIGIHQSSIPKVMRCAVPRPPESTNKRQVYPPAGPPKAAKRRKGPQDRSSDEETEGFLEQDEDGNQFYIPPAGGIPLISTQSAIMSSKLSRYHLLILDQLELYEANMKSGKSIRLRCQNCKADPRLVTTKKLTSIGGWHKVVKQFIGLDHFSFCVCLSQHMKQEIDKALKNKKDTGTLSLSEYCDYLTILYKMEDAGGVVVFGECQPIRPGYCGAPVDPLSYQIDTNDPDAVTTVNAIPRHDLIPGSQLPSVGVAKVVSATASKRMILSDYNYSTAAQYKFVMVKRKMPMSSSSAKRSRSPLSSLPDLAIALRCQHCDYTRTLKDIRDFSSQSTHFLSSHLKKCPNYPEGHKKELDELKDTQSFQKNETVITTAEYARTLMLNVYGMVDLEWNGVSGGVGLPQGDILGNMNRLGKKYGSSEHLLQKVDAQANDISWESFAVPLILEDVVESISPELPTKLTSSSSAQLDLPSSKSTSPSASTEDDSPGNSGGQNHADVQPSNGVDEVGTAEGSVMMQLDDSPDDSEAKREQVVADSPAERNPEEKEDPSRKAGAPPASLEQNAPISEGAAIPGSDMNKDVDMEDASS